MKVLPPLELHAQPASSVGGAPLRLLQPEASEPPRPLRLVQLLAPVGLMILVSVHPAITVHLAPPVLLLVLQVRFSLQRVLLLPLPASHALLVPTVVQQAWLLLAVLALPASSAPRARQQPLQLDQDVHQDTNAQLGLH